MTILSNELQSRLALDARTRWACDLSAAQFGGLLWIVGELETRGRDLLRLLDTHAEPTSASASGLPQCRAALEAAFKRMRQFPATDNPAFPESLRRQFSLGKYTRWAETLSADGLTDLLQRLGEACAGLAELLAFVDRHPVFTPWTDDSYIRGRVALEGLVRFLLRGERFDAEQARIVITSGMREWLQAQFQAVPDSVKAAADRAAPGTRWQNMGRSREEYLLAGEDSEKRWNVATITKNGSVSVLSAITASGPQAALAALGERKPKGGTLFAAHAIGPDVRTVQRYKVVFRLPSGEMQTFEASADGKDVTQVK